MLLIEAGRIITGTYSAAVVIIRAANYEWPSTPLRLALLWGMTIKSIQVFDGFIDVFQPLS
jgi:hypothetical protein